jgi:hypothetical protein
MVETDLPRSASVTESRQPDIAGWLAVGTIGVVFLFLAAVYAPQRVKLPVLTPVALGAVAGLGLGWWAVSRKVSSARFVLLASWGLIAAGEVAMSVETHRLGAQAIRDSVNRRAGERSPQLDMIDRELLERAPDEAARDKLLAEMEEYERRRQATFDPERRLATFAGYLEHRIPSTWGTWPAPWPELFWLAEVLLASALGAWIARKCIVSPPVVNSAG